MPAAAVAPAHASGVIARRCEISRGASTLRHRDGSVAGLIERGLGERREVARRSAHRLRLRLRNPRRLPLRLKDLPGPAPDPSPLERPGSNRGGPSRRAGRSSAAFTVSLRPSSSRSWKSWIASAAFASVANWTNAKPRGWPVSRSAGRYTSTTLPASDRNCVRASAVVPRFKFPTKIRAGMAVLLPVDGPGRPLVVRVPNKRLLGLARAARADSAALISSVAMSTRSGHEALTIELVA